jgi:hypothetical protein
MQVTAQGLRDPRSCASADRRVKDSKRRSDMNMEVGRGSNCEPHVGGWEKAGFGTQLGDQKTCPR